jgi:SAM-dependent methyltransferase
MPEFDEFANDYAELLSDPVRDRFAPGSKFFFTRKWELLLDYCSAVGVNPSGAAWLDVGCGRGELLGLGAGTFRRVSGCDISGGMLKHCAAGVETVVQTDPTVLPFGDGEFDLVTAVCVYHHVPVAGRKALTAELVRVLRPGGTACIIEHNPFNPVTRLIVSRTPVDADAILLPSRETSTLLRSAGLEQLQTRLFLYFPESLYRKATWVERALSRVPAGGQYATFARRVSKQ